MLLWLAILASIFFVSLLSTKSTIQNTNGVILYVKKSVWKPIYILLTVGLVVFAGFRSGIGDTGYYMWIFEKYRDLTFDKISGMKEPGFKTFIILLGKFFDNPQYFLLVCSAITIVFIFITLYRYSENLSISLFLFVTLGFYISTMNGLRQYLVIATLFLANDLLIKKKMLPFIILCILLSTVHTSAFFMIPIYFFVNTEAWSARKIIVVIGFLIALLFFGDNIVNLIADEISDGQYGNYTEGLTSANANTASVFRVAVVSVPAILSFILRKKFSFDDREYNIYSNMAILTALLYCMTLKNWVFARVAMYTNIYSLLLYPMLLNQLSKKHKSLVYISFYLLFTVYYMWDVKNLTYTSYYFGINKNFIGDLTYSFYS